MNLSSSCLALVALWCADKRMFSAVALVRVGRALLFPFPLSVRACSQRLIRLHLRSSEMFIHTVLHAHVVHFLNSICEQISGVPGLVKTAYSWFQAEYTDQGANMADRNSSASHHQACPVYQRVPPLLVVIGVCSCSHTKSLLLVDLEQPFQSLPRSG